MSSTLQNDQKVVTEGRSEKLKGVEVPLRDQIDANLLKQLKEEEFGQKIGGMLVRANGERSERLQRRQAFLSDWDNFRPAEAEGPYQGTSDLHLPITFMVIKTYHARMFSALMSNLPAPRARRPDGVEREPMINELMKYTVKDWANDWEGIEGVLDNWVLEWCAYGEGTLKARWESKYERFKDVTRVPRVEHKAVVGPDGQEMFIPQMVEDEKEQDVTIPIFNGPQVDFIPEEDLNLVGDSDPQKADLVAHSQLLTASELWTLVDQKIFDEDAVKNIIKHGETLRSRGLEGDIKMQKAQLSGQVSPDTTLDNDRYKITECYCSYDVYGGGINSEIVAWIHPDTGEIARATFLRRLNRTGKRPFFRSEFFRRPGADHPIGLIEILLPVAKEMDALHNIRIDAGLFSSIPFGFYKASSSLNPEVIKYEPGSLIPLDNPQTDVYFPQIGNKTAFGLQEEQGLYTLVERLTGVSDLTLGAMSGTQGAARTATGVRGLVNESSSNLDVHLKRLFKTWKQFLKYLLGLLQQRINPGFAFKITGDDGNAYFRWVRSKNDIQGDFDFEIDPSSADSNPQVRVDKATQVYNMVMNPLLIQSGIVNQRNIFEAVKGVLIANGVKDWAKYVSEPAQMQVILSPREEALRVLNGESVPVSPQGDHQGFVQYFEFMMSQPELLGSFGQQEVVALAKQAQQHRQMLQAMQQAQAQQSNLSQMQFNAAQSQQQAPTGAPAQIPA